MYNMGSIPAVLNIANTINHPNWLFLADFHKAINFQTASQAAIKIIPVKRGAAIP